MHGFDDIIELLLTKKATLREELEREFAERSAKIDLLLETVGYVPPVEEETAEQADGETVGDGVVETVPATEQVIY